MIVRSCPEIADHCAGIGVGVGSEAGWSVVSCALYRRGSKLNVQTPQTERLLDDFIVATTAGSGVPAPITFFEPNAVVVVDTIDDGAGIAMWPHEDLGSHRLLNPDWLIVSRVATIADPAKSRSKSKQRVPGC